VPGTAVAIPACASSLGNHCRASSCRCQRFAGMKGGASASYQRRRILSKFRRPAGDSKRSRTYRRRFGRTPPSAAFIRSRPASSCWMTSAMRRASVTARPPSCATTVPGDSPLKRASPHKVYRLGLHPLGREFIAMAAVCVVYAYDDDLRLLWRTTLADTPQIQALRRRFAICDGWLKNHIRCVALARDRSRYLFTAVDQAWCVDPRGEVLWGLKLPLRDGWTRLGAQAGASAEVGRALTLLELALPVTPLQIRRRYRELAMRWAPRSQ
jgi:hypothetical protein